MGWGERWRTRVRALKSESLALYLAARDPRTPLLVKLILALVAAYALSPIDLIPDFIPVLGYLDELLLLPLGIALALRLVPGEVMAECRARAREIAANGKPRSYGAAAVIVLIWLGCAVLLAFWARRFFD